MLKLQKVLVFIKLHYLYLRTLLIIVLYILFIEL